MSPWRIIENQPAEAAYNMAFDEALLESVAALDTPILRFYSWTQPAATFGYFQHYKEIAAWTPLRPLIRRPTGGGLVPHDADWTYSIVIPPNHDWYELRAADSYRRLHELIAAALNDIGAPVELAAAARKEIPGQCFAGPEQYDLLHHGKKIAGAAQRRNKHGLLIQGSIQKMTAQYSRAAWEKSLAARVGPAASSSLHKVREIAQQLAAAKYSQTSYNERR